MRRYLEGSIVLFASISLAVLANPASAQTPLGSAITYQGQLKNAGSPASGSYSMVFALYDAPTGGNQVGPSLTFDGAGGNPAPITVTNGLFTVPLDFGAAYNGDKRWLDITVSSTPLTPRQELTATPYSRFSAAPWVTSGSNVLFTGGNVGIGTTTPQSLLSLGSGLGNKLALYDDGVNNKYGFGIQPGLLQVIGSDSAIADIAFGWGSSDIFTERMRIKGTGNVGIGTASPEAKLDVNGTVRTTAFQLTNSPAVSSILTSDSNGMGTWQPLTLPPIGASGLSQDLQSQLLPLTSPSVSGISVAGTASTGPTPTAVALSGSYAYVLAAGTNTLQVFNVSNPNSPTLAGSAGTGPAPAAVAVSGNYAYVVNGNNSTLQVFNVSSPASPVLTGTAGTGIYPNSVAVSSGYAYVVNANSSTLQAYNVIDPANPTLVGSIGTGFTPFSVAVSGGYAYVVNANSNTLQIFNVNNPASPTLAGSAATGSFPTCVAVSGGYAYVTNNGANSLQAFNVSNPSSPTSVGSTGTGSGPYYVSVSGGTAFVVNNNANTLQIFNVSTPGSPVLAGTAATGNAPYSVAALGNMACVVNGTSNTLQTFRGGGASQFPSGASFPGNLGLGVSAPAFPLTFANSLGDKISLWGQSGAHYGFGIQGGLLQIHSSSAGDDIALGYGSSASFIERMRIKGNGNIGIGTNNPADMLSVVGSGAAISAIDGSIVTKLSSAAGTGKGYVGTSSSSPFVLRTGGNDRVTIDAAGNVGIGTTSPVTSLEVSNTQSAGGITLNNNSAAGAIILKNGLGVRSELALAFTAGNYSSDAAAGDTVWRADAGKLLLQAGSGSSAIAISEGNSVGIGTANPVQKLHVVGNICATGSIGGCSDARFKKNVMSLNDALDQVTKLRGVSFEWKRDEFRDHQFTEGSQIGFIAQEVEKVLPQIVQTGSDGYRSVDYGRLTPMLVEAIKQMRAEKDEQIATLRQDNSQLRAELDELKQVVSGIRGNAAKEQVTR